MKFIRNMFKLDVNHRIERWILFLIVFVVAFIFIMGIKNIEIIITAVIAIVILFVIRKLVSKI